MGTHSQVSSFQVSSLYTIHLTMQSRPSQLQFAAAFILQEIRDSKSKTLSKPAPTGKPMLRESVLQVACLDTIFTSGPRVSLVALSAEFRTLVSSSFGLEDAALIMSAANKIKSQR